MRVVTQNTEKELFENLKNYWETQPTQRCAYLRFSDIDQDKEEWLPLLKDALARTLEDKFVPIYVCHDDDVFILDRTLTHKQISKFLFHLSHLHPHFSPALTQGLASLFEVGIHWNRLKAICMKKIEKFEMQKALQSNQQDDIEIDLVSREEIFNNIDLDLIQSLPERRMERKEPEIMVVEDDLFSQKLVNNALKSKYSLFTTGDGRGAVMGYVKKAPDVLFLDIGLPDICGHEVLEKIFEIDPSAYVVMFSGNGDRENITRAVELGAKGFVGKPFTQEKLIQYIEKSPFMITKRKDASHGNTIH